jgi:hypothetical protein
MESVEIGQVAMMRNAVPDKNLKAPAGARIELDRELKAACLHQGLDAVAKGTGVALG